MNVAVKSTDRAKRMAKMRASLKTSVAKANQSTEDKIQEENDYQRQLQWLEDHGEPDADERLKDADVESDNNN